MRALIIDPYRQAIYEKDIAKSLKAIQDVVHGDIQYAAQFSNGDILYVHEEGEFHFDPRFGFDKGETLPGFGVVVGAVGPENDQGPALSPLNEIQSHVNFFIPIAGVANTKFNAGKPTGLVVPSKGPEGSSAILLGGHIAPQSVLIVFELSKPTAAEIEAFKSGQVEVAVSQEGNATILSWRFTKPFDRKQMWFETPFHMGLQEPGTRYLLPRESSQHGRLLTLLLQDEKAVCHVARTGVLAPEVSYAMEEAVIKQVIDAATNPAFRKEHDADLQRYFARTPDPQSGFDAAPVRTSLMMKSQMTATMKWLADINA